MWLTELKQTIDGPHNVLARQAGIFDGPVQPVVSFSYQQGRRVHDREWARKARMISLQTWFELAAGYPTTNLPGVTVAIAVEIELANFSGGSTALRRRGGGERRAMPRTLTGDRAGTSEEGGGGCVTSTVIVVTSVDMYFPDDAEKKE
ncbi:uncharacterized protein PG986_002197 [Apiospora aurea]|uniref:Uncharacterized protein n=1 Tax=Apiospora aurea TaxID=335848 RepID=A0ABR1R0V4_9PEZI